MLCTLYSENTEASAPLSFPNGDNQWLTGQVLEKYQRPISVYWIIFQSVKKSEVGRTGGRCESETHRGISRNLVRDADPL